jgi:hypothetical protein
MNEKLSRREILAAALTAAAAPAAGAADEPTFRLATFSEDVTPPVGHPCMGGGIAPVKTVADPLFARGLVLWGAAKPVVIAVIDWCEIRNDAFDRWRAALAEAAGTEPARVLVSAVHQHDAPIADLEAQRLLDAARAAAAVCDPAFHERAVTRVAEACRKAAGAPRRFTHVGTGAAKVEQVASNRRWVGADGKPRFGRTSATRDPMVRAQPEGAVDPMLKTLSFFDGDAPLAALSCYAVHPMSHYGRGEVSADFVGAARRRRQAELPAVFSIYASGCSGNVTAGKYNDGDPLNRPVLADRIHRAMLLAWDATKRRPVERFEFRSAPLRLEPRDGPGFTVEDLRKRLTADARPFGRCLAALGLSWRRRADAGHTLDVPALDFGFAQLLLLPGESYVEYQLLAAGMRPESFVVTLGYGESATGYVPTEQAFAEGDTNLNDWCWVAPGCGKAMTAAIEKALRGG